MLRQLNVTFLFTGLYVQVNYLENSNMLIVCNANRRIMHNQLKREQRYNASANHGLTVRALHVNMRYV